MTFSQSNYGITPKYENCFFFSYLVLAHSVQELQAAAYGSVFDTITINTFKEHIVRLPSEEAIKQFEVNISPYFIKINSNTQQIRTLTQLRDILLPKLMSGEATLNI
jgi:type I restriction enzyme S subunit